MRFGPGFGLALAVRPGAPEVRLIRTYYGSDGSDYVEAYPAVTVEPAAS